ncbi:F-box/LRR-repeat protein At5g02910-like isoform X3 [Euphorbia lathyris]|uniref:F-box/LRR-repeat protein At5g02910-like isoform X3 n=1 Tax=Euphorbia lathyris TaxID=212925 RepID=UPI0033134957
MAGTASASMVESDGSCESENGNKRFNSGEEEDRLSALPDFLIHHILSFLPATDLVKTLILSKWWKYQWTHVPVLKFVPNHDFFFETDEFEDCMGHDCINFVHQTILQVQHVQKLEIGRWLMEILSSSKDDGDCIGGLPDSVIHRIISFLPSTKDVFESDLYKMWQHDWIDVPILNFVSNEKFVIDSKDIPLAYLDPRLSLWLRFAAKKDVKELILDCDGVKLDFDPEYPLPQFLFNNSSLVKMKICACDFMPNMKVNWESLKSLHLEHSELGDQAIENVLAGSPLLECLELRCCGIQGALVIASNHLKTFVLHDFGKNCHHLEISCPNLESLIMRGNVGSTSIKLMNLPSSLHATLDLYVAESDETTPDDRMNLVEETMKQIMHVEKLEIELSRFSSLKSDIGS